MSVTKNTTSSTSLSQSLIRALNRTCSTLVLSATIASVFLFHRHAFTPSLFVFAVCNALWGKTLKRLLAMKRPAQSQKQNKSLGMPSSHANALAFHTMYLSLALFHDYCIHSDSSDCGSDPDSDNALSSSPPDMMAARAAAVGCWLVARPPLLLLLVVGMVGYTLCVCYARVFLTHDHTSPQILAGLLLGSLDGWFALTWLYPSFAALYDSAVAHVYHSFHHYCSF